MADSGAMAILRPTGTAGAVGADPRTIAVPYPAIETRDLTSAESFYLARIGPRLEESGESSTDRLLARVAEEEGLRERFPRFARDYADYVAKVADELEAVVAR